MNKSNLLLLADYLEKVPQEEFNMLWYRGRYDEYNCFIKVYLIKDINNCGTAGCALGHSIVSKIKELEVTDEDYSIDELSQRYLNFEKYSDRVFNIPMKESEWEYLFSGEWSMRDNTPLGASKRIRYVVEKGLPEDWYDEITGETELSYV